jgi:hypothetical protein
VWRARSTRIRQSGRGKFRRVRISAVLRSSAVSVSPSHRIVTLDVLSRGVWRRLARTATRPGGLARWTVGLPKGRHQLRVSYGGRWDLRGARSHLRVRVR